MWNISKEAKDKFVKSNLLPIHESDEEWELVVSEAKEESCDLFARLKEELEEVKDELVEILPGRFIPYVENGTLNQPTLPKAVREDYLQWIEQETRKFEQVLDAADEQTKQAVSYLSEAVQEVFAESLHDATIECIHREGDTLHLYINTEGGFSSKSLIHFRFQQVIEEMDKRVQVGQWLIYTELQKIVEGFAFRVLFDCPEKEWTVVVKNIEAQYYYRPLPYMILRDEEKMEETTITEYISQLNPNHKFYLITPDVTCEIIGFSDQLILENGKVEWGQNEWVVSTRNERFIYKLEKYNPITFIYTDIFEDPYEQMNMPVPIEELEETAWSEDLNLQVRAWNTMYANPKELAVIINRVLSKIKITKENEMMVHVYVNHFYKEGILENAMIEKYRTVID